MTMPNQGPLLEKGLAGMLQEGTVAIPSLLLKYYPELELADADAMLLIHLISFVDKEKNDFPTIKEIQSRLASSPDHVLESLQKLMTDGWIRIDEAIDPVSGVRFEKYNLNGLYVKLASRWFEDNKTLLASESVTDAKGAAADLFTIFEQEFARPLTPMELETISGWLDKDRYQEELILAALKEAVFAGKIHFRYVDRILLEWGRNRIYTAEQAKQYTQRFRGTR